MNISSISNTSTLGRLLRYPLMLIPKSTVLPILQGSARGMKWITGAHDHGCWLGSYEYKKRSLFERTLQTGDCLYDIGAHAGYYSLIASRLVDSTGDVFAFEPVASNIDYLTKHIAINGLTNVHIIESAVSDTNGLVPFSFESGSAIGRITKQGAASVRSVSLDEFIGNHRHPTHLKIDVEGAEMLALKGAQHFLRAKKPTIFLAMHSERLIRE